MFLTNQIEHRPFGFQIYFNLPVINLKCSASERSRHGDTVILNVGGSIHQVKWDTIDKFPNSRLQRLRYATSEGMLLFIFSFPTLFEQNLLVFNNFCFVE
jgi:hypothetical protein